MSEWGKWISVKDRLPSDEYQYKKYICSYYAKGVVYGTILKGTCAAKFRVFEVEGKTFRRFEPIDYIPHNAEITHWTTFPEPFNYEEKENEN